MSEIKKLGFGLMRLPRKSGNATDIDMEPVKGGMPAKVTAGAEQISAYNRTFETEDYTAQNLRRRATTCC